MDSQRDLPKSPQVPLVAASLRSSTWPPPVPAGYSMRWSAAWWVCFLSSWVISGLYVSIYISDHVDICTYVCTYVCTYGWMYVCMHACMYVCVCNHWYVHIFRTIVVYLGVYQHPRSGRRSLNQHAANPNCLSLLARRHAGEFLSWSN